MIELQIINRILSDKNLNIINNNNIDSSMFTKHKNEFDYIINHFNTYGNVPDTTTFLSFFNNFDIIDVKESEEYLVNTLREQSLFDRTLPILQKASEIMETNSNDAVEYLLSKLGTLKNHTTKAINLIEEADIRLEAYLERTKNSAKMVTYSGFEEVDKVLGGFNQGEELVCILGRLGQGKSWVLDKLVVEAWKQGRRVGIYSGEMSANQVGYRLDTLISNLSNKSLMYGYELKEYQEYIDKLKTEKNPIMIITPEDLGGFLNITKLERFIDEYKLDIVAIDQLSLMEDERSGKSTENRFKQANITRDLFALSTKHKIPIYLAIQANRMGARSKDEKGTPDIENIAESDAIGQNASRVISMRNKGDLLELEIKKNRYGKTGDKFVYSWNIDLGQFSYVPSDEKNEADVKRAKEIQSSFDDGKEVF